MERSWCQRNAQICNKIDTWEGSIEIASAAAPFYLEKGAYLFSKGRFPDILKAWSKMLQGAQPPDPYNSFLLPYS